MFRRLNGLVTASLLLIGSMVQMAFGQDYVGILPEMLKPEVADKLGLSEDQRAKVQELIRSRTSAAIGLSQQLKEAPLDQQGELRARFGQESEAMAFELLDDKQKDLLAKYRVEWMGLMALADPAVAKTLNLADWQQEIVREWGEKIRRDRRGPSAERTRNLAQQAIRSEISDSQWARWQLLAGQITETDAGEPMPPVRDEPSSLASSDSSNVSSASDGMAAATAENNSLMPVEEIRLTLNIQAQPWGDVIKWLADQADLSLQSDVLPPGSFNYRDRSRSYSVTEAMDIMNASLLSSGYTLIRSGRMLRCVDFEQQEAAGEFIREIADLVSEEELAGRGAYEPVQHIFFLQRLDPVELKADVEQMLSLQGSVVAIPSTGQLIVTDMARNVRAIQAMITRAEDPDSTRGSSIQSFPLKHINAEEVLSVARPHLGLEEGVNKSDEISISTSTFGTTIYAMGDASKIQNLRDLILQMDVVPDGTETSLEIEQTEIRRHKVVGTDMQLAYEIVSQLLAGAPDVRLAQDAVAKQLVLQARPSEHTMVQKTLADLAGETSDFKVIQLRKLDTQLAIAAIKKFFGLTDDADGESGGPVIDGDMLARQVWVKGSATQVEQIREFLDNLEENATSTDLFGENIKTIPLTGRQAAETISQVEQLWNSTYGKNKIRIIESPASRGDSGLPQRSFAPNQDDKEAVIFKNSPLRNFVGTKHNAENSTIPSGRLIGFPQEDQSASDTVQKPAQETVKKEATVVKDPQSGADILIMQGPGGLIISSEDTQALARFESMMRLVAEQANFGSGEPTVIYLKNIKAAAAKELLETILSGTASSESDGGGLLGDMAGQVLGGFGGGMFGAMLGGGGGDTMGSSVGMASGDYTITADPRLNALIVKASASDMSLIEQLLEVIDQVESPISIATRGQVAMIPVVTQDAEQVATVIKGLYGDRIEGAGSSSRGGGQSGGGGQPNPADIINALRGGGGRSGRGGGTSTQLAEAKISISAEPSTNMLIVIAQPQDIEEIRSLVNMIDAAGQADPEDIGYANLDGKISGTVFGDSISRMLGPQAKTNVSSRDTPTSSSSNSSQPPAAGGGGPVSDAAQQAQRAAFFERLRSGGGFGGGGNTGGFGGRGTGGGPTGGGVTGGRGGRTGGGRGGN